LVERDPLDGLRVLDLSRVLAGPLCTMTLSDLGADVIKVERPGSGDETRAWGPPFAADGESSYFLSVNRGKRSVALDLSTERGRELALDLAASSDVVVENFRVGGLEAMGLGFEVLSERRPGMVLCSISGFGSARSPVDRPGYDFIAQAESGLMAITGPVDGEPTKVGVAVVDVLAGLQAAAAVLAALRHRDETGEGCHVEVSLLDSAIASLVNVVQGAIVTGAEASRFGSAHPSIVPYQPFEAADGWIAVAAANDATFARLVEAMDLPELASDERFQTNPGRVRAREDLIPVLAAKFAERSVDDWVDALEGASVPVGKVRGPLDALGAAADAGDSATFTARRADGEEVELVRSPISLDGQRTGEAAGAPPRLGEHGREVLERIGLDAEQLDELERAGVLGRPAAAK